MSAKIKAFMNAKLPKIAMFCYQVKCRIFKALYEENTYSTWVNANYPSLQMRDKYQQEIAKFQYRPLISVVMPTYNTNIDFLHRAINSVLSQFYDNLEFVIVDDASPDARVREVIAEVAQTDERVKYKFLDANLHIAGATNEAFNLATGEFVALFDHDDELWPNALFEIVKLLNEHSDADFIYTDEDKIDETSTQHFHEFFKPDWNLELLRSINYMTHFSVIRKSLIDKVGGERHEYNGTQDWEFFLRLTRHTNKIYHIQKVLYSWRVHSGSTAQSFDSKPYVFEAQERALTDDLKARGYENFTLLRDQQNNGWNRMLKPPENAKVSIVIPSKNAHAIIQRCLESIYAKTTYQNFEVIVVDTGSDDENVAKLYELFTKTHRNFRVIEHIQDKFSYAETCNFGAQHAHGEYLVLLNNDTEVVSAAWLELLLGDACDEGVGAVGAMLLYPGGEVIQHAGILTGIGGVASNAFSTIPLHNYPFSVTQHALIFNKREVMAITGACLMLKKSIFDAVNGFDPNFAVTYNDVDLCLRIRARGFRNLYNPYVKLIHHESISLGRPELSSKRDINEFKKAEELFKSRYPDLVENGDPFFNKNLDKSNPFYILGGVRRRYFR
jgi:glycosyltransferase involved in cell wall biosynthesis